MAIPSSVTDPVFNREAAVATDNPPIIPWVRWFTVMVALILMLGSTLFFAPDFIGPRWPWQIAKFPFNERFLGAIYLSEMFAILMVVVINRWTPARVIMPMAITFSVVVTLVSFIHLDKFDFNRVAGWAWFVVYILPPLVWGYYYLRYRHLPPRGAVATSPGWRTYLYTEGAIVGLYGLLLLVLPATFGTIWPWKVDDFHLRVYSSLFLVLAIGAFIMARQAAAIEFRLVGLGQVLLGLTCISSVIWVDSAVHKVNWANPAIYIWFGGFALLALAGAVMMLHSQRMRVAAP